MLFTWEEQKRKTNLSKHGFDFIDSEKVISGITLTFEDDRFEYGEQRLVTLGMLIDTVVTIAHTEHEGIIRIISMRKATKHEQKIYFKCFAN